MDLILWIDENQEIAGFQLTYDKPHSEHALTWSRDGGYYHHRMDDGESRPGKYKETPILTPDGALDTKEIANKFMDNANNLDSDIVDFVYQKIHEFTGRGNET